MNTRKNITQSKNNNFLKFENEEELIDSYAEAIHLDIVYKLNKLLSHKGINKSDLASLFNTSKSFITQIFRGDKLINLKFLAKLRMKFNVKIDIDFIDVHYNLSSVELTALKINKYKNTERNKLSIVPINNLEIRDSGERKYTKPETIFLNKVI